MMQLSSDTALPPTTFRLGLPRAERIVILRETPILLVLGSMIVSHQSCHVRRVDVFAAKITVEARRWI
jgi:hypothetical protein